MAEYIKREDAYTTLTDYYHHSTEIQHMALKEALDRVPAADVVERKTGKWIDGDRRKVTAICSECGHLRLGNSADWCNKHGYFCERCGSKNGDCDAEV